jgi:threonine/homoserine efflux transporter RhtA
MIVFSLFWFLLIAAMAVLPMVKLQKGQATTWWDYTYPFTGVAVWFPLGMFNVGSIVSLSNFVIEVFWVAVVSVVVPWVRWLWSRFLGDKNKTWSFVLTLLPIVAAIAIRLMMPTLPE